MLRRQYYLKTGALKGSSLCLETRLGCLWFAKHTTDDWGSASGNSSHPNTSSTFQTQPSSPAAGNRCLMTRDVFDSRQNVSYDVAFDVGQAKIAAGVAVGEALVVEA